jgi:hypothetical protein
LVRLTLVENGEAGAAGASSAIALTEKAETKAATSSLFLSMVFPFVIKLSGMKVSTPTSQQKLCQPRNTAPTLGL